MDSDEYDFKPQNLILKKNDPFGYENAHLVIESNPPATYFITLGDNMKKTPLFCKFITLLPVLYCVFFATGNLYAATITVTASNALVSSDSFCSITEAIQAANTNSQVNECTAGNDADSGGDIIILDADIVINTQYENDVSHGRSGTPAISSIITLKGKGHTVERDSSLGCTLDAAEDAGEFRILRVEPSGNLFLEDIIIKNGCADGTTPDSRIGGAISNFNASLEVRNSIFTGNQAQGRGGAIDSTFGGAGSPSTVIINSYFKQNHAVFGGGAVSNFTSTTSIANSTFQNNTTDNIGGALYNIDGTAASQNSEMLVNNSTFDNNSTLGSGGTIYNSNASISELVNSTFANSNAGSSGKVLYNTSTGSIIATSTLFSHNSGGTQECFIEAGGGFTHINGITDNSAGGCSATQSTQINLLPLADNGCRTTTLADETCIPTMALMPDSDAINPASGTSFLEDQRGFFRLGERDIGAYEYLTAIEQCGDQLGIVESTNGNEFTAIVVDSFQINQAIICANRDDATLDTIKLNSDIVLNRQITKNSDNASSGVYGIETPMVINGQNHNLERNPDYSCVSDNNESSTEFRILEITANGNLQLDNIGLHNGCADDNSTATHGGGILNNGVLQINNSTIHSNHADYGGGISNNWKPPQITPQLSILNSVISENTASYDGAGLENTLATVSEIRNTVFKYNDTGNITGKGGAIFNDVAPSLIENITNSGFYGNNALTGAAVYNADTIGTGFGGGISKSTFSDNTAMEGGAIRNVVYIYSITDSTFSNNRASNGDGGAINTSASITEIDNVTFVENTASSEGGGIYSSGGVTNLNSSLFKNNAGSGSDCLEAASAQVNGNGNLSTGSGTNNFCVATIDSGLDGNTVDRLSDNGCTTPLADGNCVMTHALLTGSQAIITTGSTLFQTDQRGYPAIDENRDIGAFEYLTDEQHCAQSGITLSSSGFTASVSNSSELIQAINCANMDNSSTDTIVLDSDISLNLSFENIDATGLDVTSFGRTGTPAISSPVNLNGEGFALKRDSSLNCEFANSDPDSNEWFRLLRISSTGALNLSNILLSNGCLYVGSQFHRFSGGAIYNSGQLYIKNSVLANNAAASGGSIYNFEGTITTLENTILNENKANFYGGALVNDNGIITTLNNNSFSDNFSFFNGGGITNQNDGYITTISRSSFINNTSNFPGGGIYNSAHIDKIINSTFSTLFENSPADGSAIANTKFGAVTPGINSIANITFFSSSASALYNNEGEIFTVNNSILGTCTNDNGIIFGGSNNLSYSSSHNCPGTTNSSALNLDQIPADNGCVEPLADGSCVMTHKISAGSDAINQGDANASNADQRGYVANAERDIGAYEFNTQISDLIFKSSFD